MALEKLQMAPPDKNIVPLNGLYLTNADYPGWQDNFSEMVEADKKRESSKPKPSHSSTCSSCIQPCSSSSGSGVEVLKNITFVVTEDCNLNCTYCYLTHKSKKKMTLEIGKNAVDFLMNRELVNGYFDHDKVQGLILEFIGGEPLLEIDLINEIVEYFKFRAFELGSIWAETYRISMTTNGVLYQTGKVQEFLARNKDKVSMSITIDGDKELHDACRVFHDGSGSYDIVESAMKQYIASDGLPGTKITLSPENYMHLNKAIKNVWGLGIIAAFCNVVFEEGWTTEHATGFYYELIKLADFMLEEEVYKTKFTTLFEESVGAEEPQAEDMNFCGGNGQMLAIGTDGRCFPCIRFMQYSLSNPEIKEQPIGDIWKGLDGKGENEFLNELCNISMYSQSDEKCRACKISGGCAICTAYHYDKFGDANIRATYICQMHQARVLANAYYWNKLYKQLNLDKKFVLTIPKNWALEIIEEDEYSKILELCK